MQRAIYAPNKRPVTTHETVSAIECGFVAASAKVSGIGIGVASDRSERSSSSFSTLASGSGSGSASGSGSEGGVGGSNSTFFSVIGAFFFGLLGGGVAGGVRRPCSKEIRGFSLTGDGEEGST
jgi:hypothetical protein